MARCSANAAAHIEDTLRLLRAAPVQHLVHKIKFSFLKILLLVAQCALLRAVVAQVDVLSPVMLQDALPGISMLRYFTSCCELRKMLLDTMQS